MNQPAKVQEPSMEEILASIRRIIADDDAAAKPPAMAREVEPPKPAPVAMPAPAPEPPPAPKGPPEPAAMSQADIDAMLSGLDEPPKAPEPAPEPEGDILDLTEAMVTPTPQPPPPAESAPTFRKIDGSSDVVFNEPIEELAPPEPPGPPAPPLMSRATSAAVDAAFNSLAHTVLVQNARTLEDLVREMLRPMLKSWLDDNLPNLVERLVRAEIERVSRGRG